MKIFYYYFFIFNFFLRSSFEDYILKEDTEKNSFLKEGFEENTFLNFFSNDSSEKIEKVNCSGCRKKLVFIDAKTGEKKIFNPSRSLDFGSVKVLSVASDSKETWKRGLVDDFKVFTTTSEKGSGRIFLQENIGETKKESIIRAVNYLIKNHEKYGIDILECEKLIFYFMTTCGEPFYTDCRKTLQDGSSAGVSHFLSFFSILKKLKIKNEIAFTGVLGDDGKIFKVSGVKRKILAAEQHGINEIFLPMGNKPDVLKLNFKPRIKICYVSHIDEVIDKII